MSRLTEVLAAARTENRAALIGYLPAGYPSADGSAAAARAMVEGGCDVIEIGLPYSDPQMDGPVIQRAVEHALAHGTNTHHVIANARAVAETGAAALVMSYWNPIERYGVDRFARELAEAGGAGVITPDLIPDEAADWIEATDKHGLDRIFLVAPSSTDARLKLTTDASGGFVYAASTMGVTGTRTTVGNRAAELVARTRRTTELPVCVGLGVSNAAQAAEIAAFADGVIVGSAFVRALIDAETPQAGLDAVRELAADLARGVRAGR